MPILIVTGAVNSLHFFSLIYDSTLKIYPEKDFIRKDGKSL